MSKAWKAVAIMITAVFAGGTHAEDAPSLHADLQTSDEDGELELIIKATSAVAMAKACSGYLRLVDKYAGSVKYLLKSNDEQFGTGTSDRDVAKKVREHEEDKDCSGMSKAHAFGFYKNVFLEGVK